MRIPVDVKHKMILTLSTTASSVVLEGLFLLLIAVEGTSRTRSRAPEKSRVDVGAWTTSGVPAP